MRPRITYANVAATLALFLALGGTSYALSVGGDDVVNSSLTGKDLKNSSVKAVDIAGLGANVVVRAGTPATGSVVAFSSAQCNQGETLISGGYTTAGNVLPSVIFNGPQPPSGKPASWQVAVGAINAGQGSSITVNPYAICAS
jgi:hypothetical protein